MAASGPVRERADLLAGEEPLEVRVAGAPFTVTMRTPGHDFDLVAGFLLSEGVVRSAADIARMDYRGAVGVTGERDYNVVDVRLAAGVPLPDTSMQRHVYTSSSCGVCGTSSIEAGPQVSPHDGAADAGTGRLDHLPALPDPLRERQEGFGRTGGVHAAALVAPPVAGTPPSEPGGKVSPYGVAADAGTVRLDHRLALPDRLRERQEVCGRTGGVHAAALFAPAADGAPPDLLCLREDVGRHNAVDKVV